MPDRNLTYFASDVHLGLDVKSPADRERRFVRFLRSIPADKTETLYLLGDIWDFWYEYRDVVPKGYIRVFAALLNLMDAGVKVKFFPGNHDVWCYSYFRELGMEILEQPYFVEIAGKKFCLGHGDGLGPGMRSYKLMRWAFHNRFLQICFSALHPWIAFRLGYGWSKHNRLAKNISYDFKGEEEPLYKWCVETCRTHDLDFIIFGHYHSEVDMSLPSGTRLMIMKDWMDTSPYAVYDGMTGILGYCPNMDL